jgi:hypothetical protein
MNNTEQRSTTTVSIEIELPLARKIETLFLQSKMKGVKKSVKISKKNFYGYLLSTGVENFNHEQLEKYADSLNEK